MKKTIVSLLLAAAFCVTAAPMALAVTAHDFTMTAVVDETILFNETDFTNNVEGNALDFIVVKSLPAASAGTLMLAGADITDEQHLTGSELNGLVFVPEEGFVGTATFDFAASVDMTLSNEATVSMVYSLPEEIVEIEPPVAHDSTLIATRNTAKSGSLTATDPQELPLTYSIVTEPSRGTVTIEENGSYTYKPNNNKLGTDSFTFKASNGTKDSNDATVTVTVNLPDVTPMDYADLTTHWVHKSAGSLATLGMVVGEKYDQLYYFFPHEKMDRGTYLLMLDGIFNFSVEAKNAGFVDLKAHMLDIANSAYEEGVIEGVEINGKLHFQPNKIITRLEAMKMLEGAMKFKTQSDAELKFHDADLIPSWAIPAMKNLVGHKMVQGNDGWLHPLTELTRAEGAEMLYKAYIEHLLQLSYEAEEGY